MPDFDQLPPNYLNDERPPFDFQESREKSGLDLSFVNDLPARTLHITSEDLEHIDDNYLDAAYELKLELNGVDLTNFSDHSLMIGKLLGSTNEAPSQKQQPLKDRRMNIADFSAPKLEEDEFIELPKLSASPTDDELTAYGKAHPDIRKIMRLFKAELIEFTKKQT